MRHACPHEAGRSARRPRAAAKDRRERFSRASGRRCEALQTALRAAPPRVFRAALRAPRGLPVRASRPCRHAGRSTLVVVRRSVLVGRGRPPCARCQDDRPRRRSPGAATCAGRRPGTRCSARGGSRARG
jgi:hypothetical protein